jgi:hypothetical protein
MVGMRLYFNFVIDYITDKLEHAYSKLQRLIKNVKDFKSFKKRSPNQVDDADKKAELVFDIPEEVHSWEEVEVLEDVNASLESLELSESGSYYTIEKIDESLDYSPDEHAPPEQDLEPICNHYNDYSGELLVALYNPIFIAIIWNFYDPTQIAANYEIQKSDFLLYFLFSLMIMPFILVMDIFLHNCNECFNGWPIHDFLDLMNEKFNRRNRRWVGLCPEPEEDLLEPEMRDLYRMCYSAQFYFMCSLFLTGVLLCTLGIQTLLANPDYIFFRDPALIGLCTFVLMLCGSTHLICWVLANLFKLWKVEELPQSKPQESGGEDLSELFERLYKRPKRNLIVPVFSNWTKVDLVKADDEVIRQELNTGRLHDPVLREKFLEANMKWLQNNLKVVFTPRTVAQYRPLILTKFRKVFGDIDEQVPYTHEPEELEEPQLPDFNSNSASLARYWLSRARRNRRLLAQAAPVTELNKDSFCIFCRCRYALQVEMIENIEDLYLQFKQTINGAERYQLFTWNVLEWQEFVSVEGHFRTLCLDCLNQIEAFNTRSYEELQPYRETTKRVVTMQAMEEATAKLAKCWLELARKRLEC